MTVKPQTEYVRIGDLHFDPRYQRIDHLNIARVNDIAKNFDPAAFGAIYVNRREDGQLFVIDGMHRVKAVRKRSGGDAGDNAEVLAVVYDRLTIVEEARLFWQQTKRTPISPMSQFHARVTAEDAAAKTVKTILEAHGLVLTRSATSKNAVQAASAVMSIYQANRNNLDNFERIVSIIARGCEAGRMLPSGRLFYGVSLFLRLYDEANATRLAQVIAKLDPETYNEEFRVAYRFIRSDAPSAAQVLVDRYNKGLPKDQKLPNVYEVVNRK